MKDCGRREKNLQRIKIFIQWGHCRDSSLFLFRIREEWNSAGVRVSSRRRATIVCFYVYVAVTKSRFQLSSTSDGDTDRRSLRLYLDGPDLRPVFRISKARRGRSSPGTLSGEKPMVIKRFRGGRRTSHGD